MNSIILDKLLKNSDELIEILGGDGGSGGGDDIIPDLSALKKSIIDSSDVSLSEEQLEIKHTILQIYMFKVAKQSYDLVNNSQNSIEIKTAGKSDLIYSVNNVNNTVKAIKTLNSEYKSQTKLDLYNNGVANPSNLINSGITQAVTNIMYSNYILVNKATFSVISIQDVPNMPDYL